VASAEREASQDLKDFTTSSAKEAAAASNNEEVTALETFSRNSRNSLVEQVDRASREAPDVLPVRLKARILWYVNINKIDLDVS